MSQSYYTLRCSPLSLKALKENDDTLTRPDYKSRLITEHIKTLECEYF